MIPTPESVLAFWFGDDLESSDAIAARSSLWFGGGASFDECIRKRFEGLAARALEGELDAWREQAYPCLALALVLDQFPRNLYRGRAESFAYDSLACAVCRAAVEQGFDDQLAPIEAFFLYVPFEHAEDMDSQARSVSLIRGLCERASADLRPRFESFLSYAIRHRDVIERFGRFPHRNAILGRASTREELAYLESGGETFGNSDGAA